MKPVKGLLILCALAAFASAPPSSCGKNFSNLFKLPERNQNPPPELPKLPELSRYIHDDKLGVTVSVPEGWSVTQRLDNPVIFTTAPEAGPNGPLANLVIETLNSKMDPYNYLAANIISLQASIPQLKIQKWAVEMVDTRTIAWIHYIYPFNGEQVEAVAYCQTREFKAYVVTGMAPAAGFAKNEGLLRAIGRSLKID